MTTSASRAPSGVTTRPPRTTSVALTRGGGHGLGAQEGLQGVRVAGAAVLGRQAVADRLERGGERLALARARGVARAAARAPRHSRAAGIRRAARRPARASRRATSSGYHVAGSCITPKPARSQTARASSPPGSGLTSASAQTAMRKPRASPSTRLLQQGRRSARARPPRRSPGAGARSRSRARRPARARRARRLSSSLKMPRPGTSG